MSSDPRYVVLEQEAWNKFLNAATVAGVDQPEPPTLDYVVVAPPPPPEEGKTDLGAYLSAEIAGAYLSSINSGTLEPTAIIGALHCIQSYLGPLEEVVLSHLLLDHEEGEAMVLVAGPNEVFHRWITDNAERLSGYVDHVYAQKHNPGIKRHDHSR